MVERVTSNDEVAGSIPSEGISSFVFFMILIYINQINLSLTGGLIRDVAVRQNLRSTTVLIFFIVILPSFERSWKLFLSLHKI
jgi:hypothetical protein